MSDCQQQCNGLKQMLASQGYDDVLLADAVIREGGLENRDCVIICLRNFFEKEFIVYYQVASNIDILEKLRDYILYGTV
jgi:hypothetical protein